VPSPLTCFIVNLASATKRREAMQALLAQHQITATWLDAVDGRLIPEAELAQHFDAERAELEYGPMVRGEIGTSLSHVNIYRQMVEQNIQYAVVLEDDVELAPDFCEVLSQLPKAVSCAEPLMVQLTHVERAYTNSARAIGERRLMRPHGGVWLTSGYFITLAAAQNLLNALYPVWAVADHWRNFEAKGLLTLYALTPNPVWESELSRASHIAPERRRRRKDRKTLIDRLARAWDTAVVRPLFVEKLEKVQGLAHQPHRGWLTDRQQTSQLGHHVVRHRGDDPMRHPLASQQQEAVNRQPTGEVLKPGNNNASKVPPLMLLLSDLGVLLTAL
jgi:glycosyl transferase family 25